MRIPEGILEALLDCWPVAQLASVGPDGAPHQVPIVFARVSERFWSAIDAKPKAAGELTRVANIRRHRRVSLLLDRYDADWSRLWWIRLDGDAAVRQPRSPDADPEVVAALDALRSKYPQYAKTRILRGDPTLLCIRPLAVHSWCPGPEPPRVPGESAG
jgi:PPOX class probable F420-dependent enzyme